MNKFFNCSQEFSIVTSLKMVSSNSYIKIVPNLDIKSDS